MLFETRPSLFALYWGRIVLIVLLLALFVWAGVAGGAAPGAAILGTPVAIWLIVILLQWRGRTYALTDRRVIRTSGIRGTTFEDATYAQIRNLGLAPGYAGGLRFDTTPPPGPNGPVASHRPRVLRWDGLPEAPRVYAFVQAAFAFELRQARTRAATEAAFDRLSADSIPCAYCTGLIDLNDLDPANPKCPRCGAPLTIPS